jgi:hypothetical protein
MVESISLSLRVKIRRTDVFWGFSFYLKYITIPGFRNAEKGRPGLLYSLSSTTHFCGFGRFAMMGFVWIIGVSYY